MAEHSALIYQTVLKIQTDGGLNNFATFIANDEKNYYVQISGEREGNSIYAEAVSNQFLKPKDQLNQSQIHLLTEMGWNQPKGDSVNFYKNWPIDSSNDSEDLTKFLYQTLSRVFGMSSFDQLAVNVSLE